jgi:hypothetical protein
MLFPKEDKIFIDLAFLKRIIKKDIKKDENTRS